MASVAGGYNQNQFLKEVTSTQTHDTWEEGVPFVPWIEVVGCFQPEGDRILVAPEEVAVGVEEVLFGGLGDQVCSMGVGDGRVVPAG